MFAGGFTIDAAESVCALNADGEGQAALDLLIDLVDKSLVVLQKGTATLVATDCSSQSVSTRTSD